uniref:Uncharacterized protein n=1 Tax=Pyramimonas obovata TaxID=1411642 RepID=A0A7S0RKS8_9CHLO
MLARRASGASGTGQSWYGIDQETCHTEMVGPSLMSFTNAMPIRADIATIFSTFIVRAQDLGRYEYHLEKAETTVLSPLGCPESISLSEEASQMTAKAFIGPILSCMIAIGIGIALHFYCKHKAELLLKARGALNMHSAFMPTVVDLSHLHKAKAAMRETCERAMHALHLHDRDLKTTARENSSTGSKSSPRDDGGECHTGTKYAPASTKAHQPPSARRVLIQVMQIPGQHSRIVVDDGSIIMPIGDGSIISVMTPTPINQQ